MNLYDLPSVDSKIALYKNKSIHKSALPSAREASKTKILVSAFHLYIGRWKHGGGTRIWVSWNWLFVSKKKKRLKITKNKLINEKEYKFIFYLNASDCSGFYINSIGVYFTEYSELKKLAKGKYKSLQMITPKMEFNDYVTDTANWVKFEINFRANGTETNFIIGNFKPDKYVSLKNSVSKSKKECDPTLQFGAYYLIDNVILSEKWFFVAVDIATDFTVISMQWKKARLGCVSSPTEQKSLQWQRAKRKTTC